MKRCKIAQPSQQQQSFCYAFAGDFPPKAYSTEFFRVVIRGYVRLYVSLSVSLSLKFIIANGRILTKLVIIPYYLVHMTFSRSRVKDQVRQIDSELLKRFQPKLTQILRVVRQRTDYVYKVMDSSRS